MVKKIYKTISHQCGEKKLKIMTINNICIIKTHISIAKTISFHITVGIPNFMVKSIF
jgi:hypothetical protein